MFSPRLLAWAAAALFTGSLEAGARKLPVRVFTVADGLPQNEITCMVEDSRGFLWVGTTDGLDLPKPPSVAMINAASLCDGADGTCGPARPGPSCGS